MMMMILNGGNDNSDDDDDDDNGDDDVREDDHDGFMMESSENSCFTMVKCWRGTLTSRFCMSSSSTPSTTITNWIWSD